MREWSFKRHAVVALICLLAGVAGAGMLATASAADTPFWTELPPGQVPEIQAPNFAQLAEYLQPAVVNISTTQVVKGPQRLLPHFPFPSPFGELDPFKEFFDRFFSGLPQRELPRRSLGSGFIINQDGYIVTDIKASSDAEELDATVVGRDPKTDVDECSPADEVGIRPGDVILEVSQQKITSLEDYRAAVPRTGDAESVLLLVRREGSAMYVVMQPEG